MVDKPKPLDLSKLINEIDMAVDLTKLLFLSRKKEIRSILKKHIKAACDFYWKYRNAPQKLWSDGVLSNDKKNELISKFLAPIDSGAYGVSKRKILDKYNEWLFKLAFKDVMGDENAK